MKREKKTSTKKNIHDRAPVKKTSTASVKSKFKSIPVNIWILIGLIVVVALISFFKFISLDFLFYFNDIGSDTINQTYPNDIHKFNLLSEDSNTGWSFYKGMGNQYINVFATDPLLLFQKLIFYIGTSIFGADFLIAGRFLRLFVFHFLFSGIIFYFYLRTVSTEKFSSVIGALLITFSGYLVVGSSWGFSIHVFKAVFLLFAFEQLFIKNRWYFLPFAFLYLSNNPFILFIYSLFIVLYALFRFYSAKQESFRNIFMLFGKMIVLGFVGLLMNLTNVFSIFQKMFFSPRVVGNASYNQMLSAGENVVDQANLGATTVLRFFSSDILGSGSNFQGWFNYFEAPLFYIGLLTLLLFPQVFIHLNKRKKIIFGSFIGFWGLTLIFPFLRHSMLAFTGDYFRFGFDFFIPFTLLFYAVYALNELDKNFKINYTLLGGTFVILLVVLFFPYNSIPLKAIDNDLRIKIVFILLLYTGLLVLMSKPKYKSIAQIGLMFLLVVELGYFSYRSYSDRVPVSKIEFNKDKGGYKDGTIDAVEYIKKTDKTHFYRTEKDYQSGSAEHSSLNDALAQAYFGTTSYSSFNQLNYVRFLEETGIIQKGDETATRWITGFRGFPLLQTFGNVKYHLSKSESPEFSNFGFDSLKSINGITILKNRYYLPFGFTYDKYIDFDDFKDLINYQITGQSLTNIYTDLSRTVDIQIVNQLLSKLQILLNIQFSDIDTFTKAIKNQLGEDESEKYLMTIRKYSTDNFRNQTALLNAFVYEAEANPGISFHDFKRVELSDTNTLVPALQFNFDIYKKISDKLKEDTLKITEFNHSKIEGKIKLENRKMLFFTIPYDKAWKIKVNGQEEILSRVNIGFSGIVLPKGMHEIELYYVPEYSKITGSVSIISIIIFWLFLAYYLYKKKKSKLAKN